MVSTSFERMIKLLMQPKVTLYTKLEHRPKKYMFGTKNYGEIPGFINKSDGDPWDVIVPGYNTLPVNKKLKIKNVEGVIFLPNGNHKIIINVHTNEKRKCKNIKKEIMNYTNNYAKIVKLKGLINYFPTYST